jgi:hypothetical protein
MLSVVGSTVTAHGEANFAAVPCASVHPAAPPASVLTFQKHVGCAARPPTGQALAGTQGAHAAAPLAKVPAGQLALLKAHAVAPGALKVPALQAAQATAEGAPAAADHLPAAQGLQVELSAAPTTALCVPGGQALQAAREAAPVALPYLPAGHGVAVTEYSGQ